MNEYSTVIGIDLGDKKHHFCVLNQAAEIEQERAEPWVYAFPIGTNPEGVA